MPNASIIKHTIGWEEIHERIKKLPEGKCYGVPRGGTIIAGLTGRAVSKIEDADFIVDDIIDSGSTLFKYQEMYDKPFFALYDKREEEYRGIWIEFPWEHTESDIKDTIIRQIQYIGEDAGREGLLDTPNRVIRSWEKIFGGYKDDPKVILSKTFTQAYDEIVILKDIELYSTCEHHLLPFFGKCHIAYIPDGKVVGISKLARLMECFSRRMQIQERLCNQIVDAIEENLHPLGSACIIEAQHFCMTSRGVEKQDSIMVTSALRGVFKTKTEARAELMRLI